MKPTPKGYFDRPVCQPVNVQGDGNGILLMHGFTGSPAHMRMLADGLAETGYTVVGAETKPYEKKGFFSFFKK